MLINFRGQTVQRVPAVIFAQENEIFLIFREPSSNFGTRMSRKARNEPGRRVEGGCVRHSLSYSEYLENPFYGAGHE